MARITRRDVEKRKERPPGEGNPEKKPPTGNPVTPPVGGKVSPTAANLGSYGNKTIDQWDQSFVDASDEVFRKRGVRVNPRILKGMMEIESGGNGNYPPTKCRPWDGYDDRNILSCGPMQIKWQYHKTRCPECDPKTVDGQIEMAAHIIGMTMRERQVNEYGALVATYFPGEDPNGTTQAGYVSKLRSLVSTMERDATKDGTSPPVPPPPPATRKPTQEDVLKLVSNNTPGVYISFPFRGWGDPIYSYGKGHGTLAANEHSGIDIWMPDNTPVNCIFGGEVICVGERGETLWDQGCGYFRDDNGGIGKISILADAEYLTTVKGQDYRFATVYGHMSSSNVRPGEMVEAGQRIGTSGIGGKWPHIHMDISIKAPGLNNPSIQIYGGVYHLVDPMPAILDALGGEPLPPVYASRVPIPQPSEFDSWTEVVVVEDGVPVLQRGYRDAAPVRAPLKAGETFDAVYQFHQNGELWWVSSLGSRIPAKGTEATGWK